MKTALVTYMVGKKKTKQGLFSFKEEFSWKQCVENFLEQIKEEYGEEENIYIARWTKLDE